MTFSRVRPLVVSAVLAGSCVHPVPAGQGPGSHSEVRRIAEIVAEHHLVPVRFDDLMNVATAAMAARACRSAPCATDGTSDEAELGRIGLDAMMRWLHDDSKYYWPQEFQNLKQGNDQTGASVGIKLRAGARYPEVSWVLAESPAAEAGVEQRVELRSIDGVSLEGAALEDAHARLLGRIASPVRLTLARPDQPERTVTLYRNSPTLSVIDCRILGGSILYLHLYQLASNTLATMRDLAARVRAPAYARGVILDLRGNAGGLLSTTEEVADAFLPSGPLFLQRQRQSELRPRAKAGTSALERAPLAVLIDADTASGAEAVAAALQDGRRATLFGSRTAATARIDTVIEPKLGGAVRFVVAELRRGSGGGIDGVGVRPDVPVDPGMNPPASVSGVSDVVCEGVVSAAPVVTDPAVARATAHLLALGAIE